MEKKKNACSSFNTPATKENNVGFEYFYSPLLPTPTRSRSRTRARCRARGGPASLVLVLGGVLTRFHQQVSERVDHLKKKKNDRDNTAEAMK